MHRILSILLLAIFARCTTNTEVDLIVHNAKIYTVDSAFTIIEAFAVKNGIFIDIGSSKDILNRYHAKEIIDAEQKAVFPGFYDTHAHSFLYADLLQQADLKGSRSMSEIIERLQAYHRSNPTKKWIVGGGWDQNLWENPELPTKDSLDKYFPEIPVYLYRIDYHAALVNSKALHLARIDSTHHIEGGLLSTDSTGRLDGLLIDNAMSLVSHFVPEPIDSELLLYLRQAQDSLLSVGLTSIVDAGLDRNQLDMLQKFYARDSLKIRNFAMIVADPKHIDRHIRDGIFQSDRLTIRSIKFLADGALGSRGACLLDFYEDSPTKGFLLHSIEELESSFRKLANTGFQVSTHAIGDSTNRIILDLYGKYLGENNNKRWRIEHAQVVDSADFEKFHMFNVIPSIQPIHATSDMYWAEERLGPDRIKYAYAYKRLLNTSGKVALGSDFPVEHINPLYGFHAAVARVDKDGLPKGGFQIENALSREEALRGMTIWAAYACFQEKKRGSIEKGKDADFVVLDKDIMKIPVKDIRQTKVLRTFIAGETVFLSN